MFFKKINENKFHIFIILIVSIIVGTIYSLIFVPKEYVATSKMVILETKNTSTNNLKITDNLFSTFREIVKSENNVNNVKKTLQLEFDSQKVAKKINISKVTASDTIKLRVKYRDEESAIAIGNELIKNFNKEIQNMYGPLEIYEIENAHIEKISYTNRILTIFVFLIIGIFISVGYILISIKYEQDKKINIKLENEQKINILSKIPAKLKNSNSELYTNNKHTEMKKAFEDLKINMQFLNINNKGKNTVFITSAKNGEGKSFVAANIATSYAKSGKKVVLIDADMQTGKQSEIFNVPNNLGFSNYLSNLDTSGIELNLLINKFIKETTIKNLNIITSGTVPPNPSELLNLPKLKQGIKDLSVFYDVVIVDGNTITESANSLILAKMLNSCLIVVDKRKTRKEELYNITKRIKNVGGKVIGIVFNRVKTRKNIKFNFKKIKLKKISKRDLKKKIKKIKNKLIDFKNLFLVVKSKEKIKLLSDSSSKQNELYTKTEANKVAIVAESPNNDKKEKIKVKFKPTFDINKFKTLSSKFFKKNNEITSKESENVKVVEKEKIDNNIELKTEKQDMSNVEISQDIESIEEKSISEIDFEEQDAIEEYLKQDDSVLVIVDVENGYCRVFSKICFIEKKIKNIERNNIIKSYYLSKILKEKLVELRCKYSLTDNQVKRIDMLIYVSLDKYDKTIEKEKYIKSSKAEEYVQCIVREYDKFQDETDNEYVTRCQRARKTALAKEKIDIEYRLDNIWKFNKVSLYDKIIMSKFAKEYEIRNDLKNESEIVRSNQNKNTYQDVVKARDIVVQNNNSAKRELLEKRNEELKLEREKIEKEKNEVKEKQKLQKEKIKIEKIEKKKQRKQEILEVRAQRKKEKQEKLQSSKLQKELEKEKQKEEARIEEELLIDNLYPKTKNNKDL